MSPDFTSDSILAPCIFERRLAVAFDLRAASTQASKSSSRATVCSNDALPSSIADVNRCAIDIMDMDERVKLSLMANTYSMVVDDGQCLSARWLSRPNDVTKPPVGNALSAKIQETQLLFILQKSHSIACSGLLYQCGALPLPCSLNAWLFLLQTQTRLYWQWAMAKVY
jgi:hypothetical protein